MARSVSSQANGPNAISRPPKTKWKRTSVRKQAAANRATAIKQNARKKRV